MMNGRNNGKKLLATRIVAHAFEIIHIMTDQNPIQVAVDAIVNCGPREDSTRIGSAGTVRRQAVDVSPLRRVNQSIALLTIGAREASFRNIKSVSECLAEELINAAKGSSVSFPSIPSVNCIKSSLEYGSCLRILSLAYSIFCPLVFIVMLLTVVFAQLQNSYAIKKKDELERVAKSNR
jgi:ribosomal protein S7